MSSEERERANTEPRQTLVPARRRARLSGDTMVDMGTPTELPPGTLIAGEYTLTRRIVRCDLGVLYDATRSGAPPCTVKALDKAQQRGSAELDHFLREARIAGRLDGPHCPAILGSGIDTEADTLWIAMEHLAGETLAERLTRLGVGVPMGAGEAMEILEQLSRGLARVHEVGVVHRDLKPANVYLSKLDGFAVKLLDFSAAYAPDEPDDDAPLGTPLWMAPEQAKGAPCTPSTDVWAVGLLAFRMLVGRSYWWGARNAVVEMRGFLDELLESQLPSASERARDLACERALPDGFDAWFARCVVRDPRRRFRNADEMAFALHDVVREADRPSRVAARTVRSERQPTMPMPAFQDQTEPARGSSPSIVRATQSTPPGDRVRSSATSHESPPPRKPTLPPPSPPPRSLPPPPPPPADSLHENPVSFAFLDEEQTRTLPRRSRPWRPVILGFTLGIAVVTAIVVVVTDASVSPAPRSVEPRHVTVVAHAPVARAAPPAPAPPAPAPPAPVAIADSGPSASAIGGVPFDWEPRVRRVWLGRVVGEDGEWSLALTLRRDRETGVTGYFAWSAVRSPSARPGEQVRESVEGTWQPSTGALELRGVTSTAPRALPVNAYRLRVGEGGALTGSSIDGREALTATSVPRRTRRADEDDAYDE